MSQKTASRVVAFLFLLCTLAVCHATDTRKSIQHTVDSTIQPMMAKYSIPGIAVGITVAGKPYVFCYGVSSTESRQPVTRNTLFEIGSLSKTFTATLAAYAQTTGYLSLSDVTSKYLPVLQNTKFGNIRLLDLATHTPGGFPIQVPENIRSEDMLMQYLKNWQPAYPPGTYRTYSNVSIGTLGLITAKSMDEDFATLMEKRLFPALGLKSSYINIPQSKMPDYAQGYTKEGSPIRMATGVLWEEAYGIKTTAPDLIRFVETNMNLIPLSRKLQHAITETHTGYYKAGPMTQDLIWEQYPYPVALKTLLDGNSPAMIFNATPVKKIIPPENPQGDTWINKTGSTNGFAAYIAFVPEKQMGIVILANRNYPIDARVKAAYEILTTIATGKTENRR